MKDKEKIAIIQNLIISCDRILEYSLWYGYNDFINDYKTFDAIIAQLMHLWEITKIYRDNFWEIEWLPMSEVIWMRNFIAHNYLWISKKIIYNVVVSEIPKIKNILELLL